MRRRIATITTGVGIAAVLSLMGSSTANAAISWQSRGVEGVKAWGKMYRDTYNGKKVEVVRANIKDTRKDRRIAAIKVAFTESGKNTDYRWMVNRHGYGTTAEGAISSYNIDHTYIKECKGNWRDGRFDPSKCGSWRKYR